MPLPRWVPFAAAMATTIVALASIGQSLSDGDLTVVRIATAAVAIALTYAAGRWSDRPRAALVIGTVVPPAVGLMTGFDSANCGWFVLVLFAGLIAAKTPFRIGFTSYLLSIITIAGAAVATPDNGWLSWLTGTSLGFWGSWAARWRIEGLEQEQAALAATAAATIAAERQRVAHDLHDVVAHTLAVTVLHLGGARLAVEHEPEEAVAAIAEAERLARASMAQLRTIVSVLADDGAGDGGRAAPQPGARDVVALIDEYRVAGLPLEVSLEGDLASVAGTHGAVLYRIVQEALANAARHAPGSPVVLELGVLADGATHLVVRNPVVATRPARDGFGITAVMERARAVGGKATAGAVNGLWVVDASLPMSGP